MLMKRYWICAVLLLTLCAPGFIGYAQRPADAIAGVPALDSFHEVIFKIWHEAWPKKNTAMLQQLLPEVEKGIGNGQVIRRAPHNRLSASSLFHQ